MAFPRKRAWKTSVFSLSATPAGRLLQGDAGVGVGACLQATDVVVFGVGGCRLQAGSYRGEARAM